MITSLRAGEIDVGVGLTEGWVAGLGKEGVEGDGGYRIVGTYVETPLCISPSQFFPQASPALRISPADEIYRAGWAISTGANREINSIADLKNGKIGVSRIGSGSYVMGFVLADQQGWLSSPSTSPFEIIPLQTFDKLRASVNDSSSDFFMWEHFTSKKYYDNGEIKKIGEIYTPWSSWKIVARTGIEEGDQRLEEMFEKIDRGVRYFEGNKEESVRYISGKLDYSASDAREWLKTVRFAKSTKGVDVEVIQKTVDILRKAGVIGEGGMKAEEMIGSQR
jgi:ABC-type nitrate/sulfonate/bicarbonate transport system substrate-binding protein